MELSWGFFNARSVEQPDLVVGMNGKFASLIAAVYNRSTQAAFPD
jgi:hypothetical protein